MKVIGVSHDCYLIQATTGEMKDLTGLETWGDADQRNIGNTFSVRKSWDTIRALQAHQKELPQVANKLRALADLLEPIAFEIPVTKD